MPYIKQEDRLKFDEMLDNIPDIKTKGELEYCIYKLMIIYKETHKWCYSDLHDCTYAAQHCSDEFRRNFLDARENEAKNDNGDI